MRFLSVRKLFMNRETVGVIMAAAQRMVCSARFANPCSLKTTSLNNLYRR